MWLAAVLGLAVPSLLPAQADAPKAPVQPREVRKVVGDGKHNAFTALAKFRGQFWLAFRAAKDHNSGDGDLVVLRSKDGRDWTEAFRLNAAPDDRDPQFLVTEKRLFLYDPAMNGAELTTFAVYTDDGQTWSKPQPVYEPRFILWKPCIHEGKFYAAAHKKAESSGGKDREVHLIVSDDGLKWQKVSTVRAGKWESETTLQFVEKGRLLAWLRQKYGSPQCQLLVAEPPYTDWKPQPAGVEHLSGHSVTTIRGVTYLLSRTMDRAAKKNGTMIYTYADGKLQPYCELPAGGDCAYAEAVELGDDLLVSYYSTHEGATNIYVALVPQKKQ